VSGVAVIAVSRAGSALATRIAAALPQAEAHVPARFLAHPGSPVEPLTLSLSKGEPPSPLRLRPTGVSGYEGRVAPVVGALFHQCDALVLVMAAGAAVRLIAPHLRDKSVDPAVVVVDDGGRFAISLIGGHAAGANRLAGTIADAIGAIPVLTTASESRDVPDIERIAGERGWRLEPGSSLTRLLAALVNGERVGVFQNAGDRDWLGSLPSPIAVLETMADVEAAQFDAALIVTERNLDLPQPLAGHAAVFHPHVLVLGIGCSRGALKAEIAALVDATLRRAGLSALAVAAVATIDRRCDEPGLLEFAAQRAWPICLRTAAELAAIEGDWTPSKIVQRAVGTPGVAEPAALAVAGVEQLIVRKVKSAHVTLAVARAAVELQLGGDVRAEEDGV